MNGANSNTSGDAVANVAHIPRGFWQKILDTLGTAAVQVRAVIAGTATPATVEAMLMGGSDQIADDMMREIARRLVVTLERDEIGNVVFSVDPPDDKTKLWQKIDSISKIQVGRLKQWSTDAGAWVNVAGTDEPFTPPARRAGTLSAPAGASTLNFTFDDIGTTDFKVTLTPTLFDGSSWAVPPGSFPANFGFFIANKTTTIVSVSFYGIPTGGLRWEIDIEDRQTTA